MIYQKIVEERDYSRGNDPKGFKMDVLLQLMQIAFSAGNDDFPEEFLIRNVFIPQRYIEQMFARMGISVNVSCVSYSHGADFKITRI